MKKRLIIAAAAVLVAGLAAYFMYRGRDDGEGAIRASGIVEGIEVNLSSKVPGIPRLARGVPLAGTG